MDINEAETAEQVLYNIRKKRLSTLAIKETVYAQEKKSETWPTWKSTLPYTKIETDPNRTFSMTKLSKVELHVRTEPAEILKEVSKRKTKYRRLPIIEKQRIITAMQKKRSGLQTKLLKTVPTPGHRWEDHNLSPLRKKKRHENINTRVWTLQRFKRTLVGTEHRNVRPKLPWNREELKVSTKLEQNEARGHFKPFRTGKNGGSDHSTYEETRISKCTNA